MSTSQLQLYKGALLALGERTIQTLTDQTEARFALDEVWGDNIIKYALQQGLWKFATRTLMIAPDPSIQTPFGYQFAYEQPSDYVKLAAISLDDRFQIPLTQYDDNNGFWFADSQPIYVQYISQDSAYGYNMNLWPQSFIEWFKYLMAKRVIPRIAPSDDDIARVVNDEKILLRDAKNKDAAEQGTRFTPPGQWVQARTAGNYNNGRYKRGGW